NNGGYLQTAHYQDYANLLTRYVVERRNSGVPLYGISIQNEPDWSAYYPSCLYTAQQLYNFLPYLYNALLANGARSTKIMLPEQTGWSVDLAAAALGNPLTAAMIGGMNVHHYTGSIVPLN